ncbi:unnamed protein product [Acanthocheilonema viteae]|uniref:Uncharacterized protein n=1 Tax=Acanthocheilonema viteae TaxID=6277 RepID=A0A498SZ07_ACAVI|nr:unnamed protein product [Acanthocheilonema viteae]
MLVTLVLSGPLLSKSRIGKKKSDADIMRSYGITTEEGKVALKHLVDNGINKSLPFTIAWERCYKVTDVFVDS